MTDHMSMHPTVVGQEICIIPNVQTFRLNTKAKLPTKLREKGVTKEVWKAALEELESLSKADPFQIKRWRIFMMLGYLGAILVPVINISMASSGDYTIAVAIVPVAFVAPLAIINVWLLIKHNRWFFENVRNINTKYFVKYGVSCHWIRAVGTKRNARRVTPGLTFHECDAADDSSDDEAAVKNPATESTKGAGNKTDGEGRGNDSEGDSDSDDDDDDDDDKAKVTPQADVQRHPNRVDE